MRARRPVAQTASRAPRFHAPARTTSTGCAACPEHGDAAGEAPRGGDSAAREACDVVSADGLRAVERRPLAPLPAIALGLALRVRQRVAITIGNARRLWAADLGTLAGNERAPGKCRRDKEVSCYALKHRSIPELQPIDVMWPSDRWANLLSSGRRAGFPGRAREAPQGRRQSFAPRGYCARSKRFHRAPPDPNAGAHGGSCRGARCCRIWARDFRAPAARHRPSRRRCRGRGRCR
jgi:hypothetical protein